MYLSNLTRFHFHTRNFIRRRLIMRTEVLECQIWTAIYNDFGPTLSHSGNHGYEICSLYLPSQVPIMFHCMHMHFRATYKRSHTHPMVNLIWTNCAGEQEPIRLVPEPAHVVVHMDNLYITNHSCCEGLNHLPVYPDSFSLTHAIGLRVVALDHQ